LKRITVVCARCGKERRLIATGRQPSKLCQRCAVSLKSGVRVPFHSIAYDPDETIDERLTNLTKGTY
jgi:NMD protein affecting ribosome stability and mRNA decay